MTSTNDSFGKLEEQRQRLEKNVQKTRAVLEEWKQWKNEYETLKKEVDLLPPDASPNLMKTMRASFDGNLVDGAELAKIFGDSGSQKPSQVMSTLVNRIDYVKRNIATMEKRLDTARKELVALDTNNDDEQYTSEDDDEYIPEDEGYGGDGGGLPVTEILEELDDDDNVVSYSLRTPGNNQPELLEALEKAGLKDVPAPKADSINASQVKREIVGIESQKIPAQTKPSITDESSKPKTQKKSVKFAEDTKLAQAATKPVAKSAPTTVAKSTEERPEYMTFTVKDIDELMREAKQQESIISDPVIPADDSEEAAQLRRDMLEYNLSELNPVVAELTLEEGGLTDEDDDDWDYDMDDDEDENGDDDDDEDQWGRSTRSVVNEEYRQKMLEIQQRLESHTFGAPEITQESDDENDPKEGIATIRIRKEENKSDGALDGSIGDSQEIPYTTKKGVRFASTLDIAEEAVPVTDLLPQIQPEKPEVDPLSETIVERKNPAIPPSTMPVAKKASRFKMARGGASSNQASAFKVPVSIDGVAITPELPVSEQQFAPSGPEGKTIATSVLERAPSETAREPDEFDADMLKQQAAVEYHKVRNRMIQKQGGFMKEDESPIRPLDEEEGGPKRLSRFKAARLAGS